MGRHLMLLEKLQEKGIMFRLINSELQVKIEGGLSDKQRDFIKLHKLELISQLTEPAVNDETIKLKPFLNICCHGLNATPDEVIHGLLSENNMSDITEGGINKECVKAHIELWVKEGKHKIN